MSPPPKPSRYSGYRNLSRLRRSVDVRAALSDLRVKVSVEAPGIAPGSRELVEHFNDYELKYILCCPFCQDLFVGLIELVHAVLQFLVVICRGRLKHL